MVQLLGPGVPAVLRNRQSAIDCAFRPLKYLQQLLVLSQSVI